MNQLAFEQLRFHASAPLVVHYDACSADPVPSARNLLRSLGLSWQDATERFVEASTSFTGSERYYQVFRNARENLGRWRQELSPEDQRAIIDIAAQTEVGRMTLAAAPEGA